RVGPALGGQAPRYVFGVGSPAYCCTLLPFSFDHARAPRALPSFPTRRSSDLPIGALRRLSSCTAGPPARLMAPATPPPCSSWVLDRKSTRLNSSHSQISYAVFCLKKKKSRW